MILTARSSEMEADAPSTGSFTASVNPGGCVALAGELDIGAIESLRSALDQAMLEPGTVLTVDAAKLSFIDSAAISELLRYQLIAAARQRWLYLDKVSHPVAKVLEILDLRHILMPPEPGGLAEGAVGVCSS